MAEMSFFYRYCFIIPHTYESISELFIKKLNEASFDVKTVLHEENKKKLIFICISQFNEAKMLREAERLHIRKKLTINNWSSCGSDLPFNSPDLKLPSKVIECEKIKKIKVSEISKYIPDEIYDTLYQKNLSKNNEDKTSDERWGLGMFTENEMLQIEKSILENIELDSSSKSELLKIYEQLNPKKKIDYQLIDQKSFFKTLKTLNVIINSFPINISNFNILIVKQSLFNFKCPYNLIRSYFNDEVALCFAWNYTFTQYILIPSFLSLLLYILYKIFPSYYKFFLSFYSLGICLWTQLFSIGWDRKQSELRIEWNNYDETYDIVNTREEFFGTWKKSLITGEYEKTYSQKKRIGSYIISVISTLIILIIALMLNVIFLNLKGVITDKEDPFYIGILFELTQDGKILQKNSIQFKLIGYIRGYVMSLMNKLNRKIAIYTSFKENHKKVSFHNNSIIMKRFLFEFVNTFFFLYYLAFAVQDLPKMQEIIIENLTTKELEKIVKKMIIPIFFKFVSTCSMFINLSSKQTRTFYLKGQPINRVDLINQYKKDNFNTFDEYLELIFEFCYLTLFSETVPMVGPILFALNILEIRTDLFKLCFTKRRPEFCKKRHIGMWRYIIIIVGFVSVFTNLLFSYTFSTSALNKDKFYSLLKFCSWEHIILGSMVVFRIVVPTTHPWVNLFLKRREYRHAKFNLNNQ